MIFCRQFLLRLLVLALLAASAGVRGEPVINEVMAANFSTLTDEDGAYSDWIEIYNPDRVAIDLNGWYLTDLASNKNKWQFPSVTLEPGGYLVVFASNKNRQIPGRRLHTNFGLSSSGEYLGLIKPDGVTVAHDFSPTFPPQTSDVSFGLVGTPNGGVGMQGYLAYPTPGAANANATVPGGSAVTAGITEQVAFSRVAGVFRNPFTLELSGAGAGQQIRYLLVSGMASGTTEPGGSWSLYQGPLSVNGTVTVRAAVFSTDGQARGKTTEAHYTHISPTLNSFTSQLPVLVIDTMGSGPLVKDEVDHDSWMYSYAARATGNVFSSTPEMTSPMETTVRGNTSAEFPKKGYNIKFTDTSGTNAAQSLPGLPAYEKWALVAPWSFDPSFLNNVFTYGLSNRMGRWAPQIRFAEVFFNANGDDVDASDYAGIYLITDRIEIGKGRVDLKAMAATDVSGSAVTGGYILKLDQAHPGEIGWSTNRGIPNYGDSSIVLVAPKASEVAPAQVDTIRNYIQSMENALVSDRDGGWAKRTYLDYIDRGSWVDHHLINTYLSNPDALVRSAYFTKDRNGKLTAGPVWDFDRAMGSAMDERSFRYDVWSGLGSPDVWSTGWWGIIARDPEFMQDWIDRWQALRQSELSWGNLRETVETLGASVGVDAAARDAARWPDNKSPYGSYANQLEHLKGWLTLRAEWIDRQFVAEPELDRSGGQIVFTPPEGAQLIYTLDGSDPRMLGGEIAPNALVTSSVLSLPSSANVHVRAYRADQRGVSPGSPWSSAIGGENSSPLTPKARLVNISARATVGNGENALITGVVVADTESKLYLSRAVGPGLASFGASGIVPDPQLSIFRASGVELFRNNGWETGPDATRMASYARSVGAFPLATGSRDSALANTLPGGAYTLQITTPSGQSGVGLAELYELDTNGRTSNLSTRARVRTGDGVLIGGFVVSGPAYKRMLIRAVGPTLSAFGVGSALLDPILTVYSGSTVVASNDRWESVNSTAIISASQTVGAFALARATEDAALLITLRPGAYTVEVKGKNQTEGVALLEIYELP